MVFYFVFILVWKCEVFLLILKYLLIFVDILREIGIKINIFMLFLIFLGKKSKEKLGFFMWKKKEKCFLGVYLRKKKKI